MSEMLDNDDGGPTMQTNNNPPVAPFHQRVALAAIALVMTAGFVILAASYGEQARRTLGIAAVVLGAIGTLGQGFMAADGGSARRLNESEEEHTNRLAWRDGAEPWLWGALGMSVIALAVTEVWQ
jgi:hypothetical protein